MLFIFLLILLLVFVVLLLGGSMRTPPGGTRSRLERPVPRLTPPPVVQPRPRPEPMFQPRERETFSQQGANFFQAAAPRRAAPQHQRFAPRQESVRPATFTGHGNIKWDALCRLTGQPHRICDCSGCEELRLQNGLNR